MTDPNNRKGPATLAELRANIDRIDNHIHDLLMERSELIGSISAAKRGISPALRPGREAEVIRRLVGRHRGHLPIRTITRIWREIMAAFAQAQTSFAVAVSVGEGDVFSVWDTARDHFGSLTTLLAVPSPMAAIRALGDQTAALAVLPWPAEDGSDPWWGALSTAEGDAPRVVARLPFIHDRGRGNFAVLGGFWPDSTSDDHGLVLIDVARDMSRGRLKDILIQSQLEPLAVCSRFQTDSPGSAMHLVEVAGPVMPEDPRLALLVDASQGVISRSLTVGGFAVLPVAAR